MATTIPFHWKNGTVGVVLDGICVRADFNEKARTVIISPVKLETPSQSLSSAQDLVVDAVKLYRLRDLVLIFIDGWSGSNRSAEKSARLLITD